MNGIIGSSASYSNISRHCDFFCFTAIKEKISAIFRCIQEFLSHFFQRFYPLKEKKIQLSAPSIQYIPNSIEWNVKIETKRCWMRPFLPADFPQLVKLWQDPDVMKFNGDGKQKSEEWIQEKLIDACKFQEKSYIGTYCIHDKKNNDFIGNFSLESRYTEGEIAVGLILHKKYHDQKFGSEIGFAIAEYIRSLRDRGFSEGKYAIRAIVTTVHPKNTASWKIQEKVGLTFEKNAIVGNNGLRKFYRANFI
jgi:RimJ/RimL family protein N-acetyltransferase